MTVTVIIINIVIVKSIQKHVSILQPLTTVIGRGRAVSVIVEG